MVVGKTRQSTGDPKQDGIKDRIGGGGNLLGGGALRLGEVTTGDSWRRAMKAAFVSMASRVCPGTGGRPKNPPGGKPLPFGAHSGP